MRLIDAKHMVAGGTISFKEFYTNRTPEYAILSHTWEEGQEVVFQECNSPSAHAKSGYDKIRMTCEIAVSQGIGYAWVDTCCIDKSSSAELSEAINSMFKWYQQATICYVYLADMASTDEQLLNECRWFRRGWTLQELIAPSTMAFYNQKWHFIGDKTTLLSRLAEITTIDDTILIHTLPLSSVLVATRLSWAAARETTREEDMAYCLLGLFDINIPMLYGEGQKAFRRLQEEIIRLTDDMSILGWTRPSDMSEGQYCGPLAQSPKEFALCTSWDRTYLVWDRETEIATTNKGVQLRAPYGFYSASDGRVHYCIFLNAQSRHHRGLFLIPMRKIGPTTFARTRCQAGDNGFWLGSDLSHSSIETHSYLLLHTLPELPPLQKIRTEINWRMTAGHRFLAVKIHLGPNFERIFQRKAPIQFWDEEDSVFFTDRPYEGGWGSIELSLIYQDVPYDLGIFLCVWDYESDEYHFKGTLIPVDIADDLYDELFTYKRELNNQSIARNYVDRVLSRYGVRFNNFSEVDGFRVTFYAERDDDPRLCCGPLLHVHIESEDVR